MIHARRAVIQFGVLWMMGFAIPQLKAELFRCASLNFDVTAPSPEIAKQVAGAAEEQRRILAVRWFGHSLPRWSARCPVHVRVGRHLGAGGSTKFRFEHGHVLGWKMTVQGSLERILDSVIPHEVNHTILACYFRRPVPRWADEGAATLIEHQSEQQRQIDLVQRLVHQGRRIPLRVLFDMKQYPRNSNQLMALYAEGYSLTEFLIQQEGYERFLHFLNDAHHRGWYKAFQSHYATRSVEDLERSWANWVIAGSPRLNLPKGQLVAKVEAPQPEKVIRSGTPSESRTTRSSTSRTVVRAQDSPMTTKPDSGLLSGKRLAGLLPGRRTTAPDPVIIRAPDPRRLALRSIERQEKNRSGIRPGHSSAAPPLQPLALRPIPGATARPLPNHQRSTTIPVPKVSLQAAFGSSLQETNLRSSPLAPPRPAAEPNWSRFPGRSR